MPKKLKLSLMGGDSCQNSELFSTLPELFHSTIATLQLFYMTQLTRMFEEVFSGGDGETSLFEYDEEAYDEEDAQTDLGMFYGS